jgi:hypothetical protein
MQAMGRAETSLRDELLAARDRLERQIEMLKDPVGIRGAPDNRSLIAELSGVLDEIDLRLSEL